jgi:hypothetical protein
MRKGNVLLTLSMVLLGVSVLGLSSSVLTIYSQGIACVQESLTLTLTEGINEVKLPVPKGLIPESAVLVTDATLLSHSFDYTSADSLFASAVGKNVQVVTANGIYRGTLLRYQADVVTIIDSSGEIRAIAQPQQVNLGDKDVYPLDPQLLLTIYSQVSGDMPATFSYLTQGLSWAGSYICTLDEEESMLSVQGQITLRNVCGVDFEQATIRFIAGDISQVDKAITEFRSMAVPASPMGMGENEQAVFEYHLYTLPETVNLVSGDELILPYIRASDVLVEKKYTYDGAYSSAVQVQITFDNSVDNNLGMPLPAGAVRLFGETDGALLLLGEDMITHTAKEETIDLSVGSAFDLVGERTQINREKIAQSTYRETYHITMQNHKDTAVSIEVLEHLSGTWKIMSSTMPYEKVDSNTIKFTIEVPSDQESEVEYTVEYNY